MAERRLPIWMHPARPVTVADYAGEPRSKYDLSWVFGWPCETSVAMGRLVFSGLFDRHPELVIITHHLGAMIPFCEGRIGGELDQLGARSDDPDDGGALGRLERRPVDYFRMFYGDTALFGAWQAMESGLAFFGADHVLFGTDFPFDPERGPGFIHRRHGADAGQRSGQGEDLRGQRAPPPPPKARLTAPWLGRSGPLPSLGRATRRPTC
jgi:predicted TIM-barrel fold metal-dependent hydrolase